MINLAGYIFGRLTAIEPIGRTRAGSVLWSVMCECGNESVACSNNLRTGNTKSCGCIEMEGKLKHGHALYKNQSPTYRTWSHMINRCTNSNADNYPRYGGRGISVCSRWKSFNNFLADMGPRPVGKTIDRKNVDGNYEPGNCRLATPKEQQNNRRKV